MTFNVFLYTTIYFAVFIYRKLYISVSNNNSHLFQNVGPKTHSH